MTQVATDRKTICCAIYTRKSHEEGLEQEFNSLDAQRDGLLIRLRVNGLNSLVGELQDDGPAEGADGCVEMSKDGQTVDLRVPMEFKVRGGRKEIILPPDTESEANAQPNRSLVLALARAHR